MIPPRSPARRSAAVVVLLVALAAVVGFVVGAPSAAAHAMLLETSPGADEVVPSSPTEIRFRFSEAVRVQADGVRVLGADGVEVALGNPVVVDASVVVPVDEELADGSYVVAWKVVSADAHPVSGAFSFAVGAGSVVSAPDDSLTTVAAAISSPLGPQIAADVTSGLAYLGALVAAGAAWFAVAIAGGAIASVVRVVRWGAVAAAIGLLVGIGTAAARLDGEWPTWVSLRDELLGTSGLQAVIGVVGAVVLVIGVTGLAGRRVDGRAQLLVVVAGSLTLASAFVVVGHTRTATPPALAGVADVVHLAAAAVWTGGLLALLLSMRRSADTPPDVARLVARFSSHAAVALAAVAVAGVVLAWTILEDVGLLTGSTYGRLLLLKVVLVGVLAAIGGYNRWRLVDRVGDDVRSADTLRTTLKVEVGVAAVIVVVTSVFSSIAPEEPSVAPEITPLTCEEVAAMENMPGMEGMDHSCVGTTTTSTPGNDPGVTPTSAPVAQGRASFGDGLAVVSLSPGTVGTNTVTVVLTTADGRAIDTEELPTVGFRLRAADIGPLDAVVERVAPGTYRAEQELLLAGEWEVSVSAVVADFEQPTALVRIGVKG